MRCEPRLIRRRHDRRARAGALHRHRRMGGGAAGIGSLQYVRKRTACASSRNGDPSRAMRLRPLSTTGRSSSPPAFLRKSRPSPSKYGVEYSGSTGSDTGYWLWIAPVLVLAALLLVPNRFSGSRDESAATSKGKSKARTYVDTSTRTTFNDVTGVDEAKEELQEIIALLRDPRRYGRLGAPEL